MDKHHGATLFLIFLLLSLALIIQLFWPYASAIVLAILLSSVFHPMYAWLKRLFRERRQVASLTVILVIFLFLVVPASWFVGTLTNEAFDLYKRTSSNVSMAKLQHVLENDPVWNDRLKKISLLTGLKITPDSIEELATTVGKGVGLFLYNQLTSIASNLFNLIVSFFLMMLTMYYLFTEGDRLKDYLIQLIPIPKEQLEKVTAKFQDMGKAIILGSGLSGIIQGILGGFGFFIFDLGFAFSLGNRHQSDDLHPHYRIGFRFSSGHGPDPAARQDRACHGLPGIQSFLQPDHGEPDPAEIDQQGDENELAPGILRNHRGDQAFRHPWTNLRPSHYYHIPDAGRDLPA